MSTAIVVFLVAAAALSSSPAETAPPTTAAQTPDAAAPDFTFTDMKGAAHTLAELRGRVVLLEFWAPWCAPCRKGFPLLDEMQTARAGAGLTVVAVTLEPDDDSVNAFVAEHPVRYLVGRDPTGRAGEIYQVAAMPTAILIDREGRLLARFEGGTDAVHQGIDTAIETALAGGAVSAPAPTASRKTHGGVRAWERGYLADRIMNLDGDTLTRSMRDHIHTSKEAASGNGGVAGGGCGCN